MLLVYHINVTTLRVKVKVVGRTEGYTNKTTTRSRRLICCNINIDLSDDFNTIKMMNHIIIVEWCTKKSVTLPLKTKL